MRRYIQPGEIEAALLLDDRAELGRLLLLLAKRIVCGKAKSFPPGIYADEMISIVVADLWAVVPRIQPSGNAFSFLSSQAKFSMKNACRKRSVINRRHRPLPPENRSVND